MTRTALVIVSITIGAAIGASGFALFNASPLYSGTAASSEPAIQTPLYWVAPMDPAYRRDEPGKSPMGMDLIPVYEDASSTDDSPGTITVSPEVINNMGVRTAQVAFKSLKTQIDTVGYVGFNEDALVHVHPRVEGWLETLNIKVEGERVQKGDPLFSLYSPELVNAQNELLQTLEQDDKKLVQSAIERLRALQVPEPQIQALIKTREVQQTITILAPKSGVVEMLEVSEGFFVQPGNTIISIGPFDQVWVTAEVFERQASRVKKGDEVSMTLEHLPGQTWKGHVDYIYPVLDAVNRTMRVRMRFDNHQEQLKPNMFAQIRIHANTSEKALIVPRQAVIRSGSDDRVVLALGHGKFKSIAVVLGRSSHDEIEVLKGLNAGDEIVVSAQFLLDSESSITSDFVRMSDPGTSEPTQVWTEGTITHTNPHKRSITVEHKAIEKWQWPPMEMDFLVDKDVDFEDLTTGTVMHFEITRHQGEVVISTTHIMSKPAEVQAPKAQEHENHHGMDHSQHQMMNHGEDQ
ncbi:efflux RND transporter periplasmic adaptor subunit [Echinimonas agarilytica]|uniref:Efflux RND transporter periplasmic adaptor subunit n=1 Tax=Echinimonas agarilytica TaxID=1215918 RepID=A0AA41W745_9GAMM|nr:efflux RND transporter periplasmic adaptor subunit [Echinimonas agarilytica]MCM2680104.1 efflux RND transporter periplasmic adaptor subunit [Echinimonas agarilytica]